MAVYINDLKTLKIFNNSFHLIAGKRGKNRKIQYITVMEVLDFADKNLGEGLFVLTTFSNCADDPRKMEEILLKLIHKNISGIAIKVNRFLEVIPDSLMKLADQYNTPLFLIDKEIAFRTVIFEVTDLIISQQYETIKALNNQYEELYTSILKGEDLSFFLQKIAKSLSQNCFCFSQTAELIAQSIHHPSQKTDVLIDYISLLNNNPEMIWQLVKAGEKYIVSADGQFFVFPCIAYNKILGYFVVQHLNTNDSDAMMNVKQITSFLSMKLMEDTLKKESETKFHIQLANEIYYNTSLDEDTIRGKMNLMGFFPDEYYYVLFIKPADQYYQNIINSSYLKKKISLYIENHLKHFLINDISDGYYIILSFNKQDRFHDSAKFKEFLRNLCKIIDTSSDFKIGCSQKEKELVKITDALKSSKRAIALGKEIYPEKNIYFFDDFFDIQMIIRMMNTKEHELIRSHIISPLEEYDRKYKSYLMNTLETCLKTNTLQEAAKTLFIHSSTLRYRLEKIQELTGQSFFTNMGRYSLTNGYFLMKLEKIHSKNKLL